MQTNETLHRYADHNVPAWVRHGLWLVPLALLVLTVALSPARNHGNTAPLVPNAPLIMDWHGNSGHIPAAPASTQN